MAAAAKCRNSVSRKAIRKNSQETEERIDARVGSVPKGRLWINGKVSEDRDDDKEVRTHCERCYDDKNESSQVQEERTQEPRRREDGRKAWEGKTIMVTVEARGPSDGLVPENVARVAHGSCV